MEPGGRQPAPGELALVQRFVNTLDIEGRRDELGQVRAEARRSTSPKTFKLNVQLR